MNWADYTLLGLITTETLFGIGTFIYIATEIWADGKEPCNHKSQEKK